jgi:GT2 family glycosyltransferase
MTRLDVVIVGYNSRTDLDRCLAAIAASAPRTPHQVVLVDNASSHGTEGWLRERCPHVRVVEAGGNLGFGRASNVGIRQTTSELVLLLNPDTVPGPGQIDRLVDALDARPNAAAAGPRLVDADGRAELSHGAMMGPFAELRQKLLGRGHARGLPVIAGLVERMTRRSRTVDWVSGACLLARRVDLEAVGLFDERFFIYTEDIDLCASLRARGRSVWFIADAEIVHLRGRSASTAPAATDAAYRRSQLAFYRKHHPMWAPILALYLKARGLLPYNS